MRIVHGPKAQLGRCGLVRRSFSEGGWVSERRTNATAALWETASSSDRRDSKTVMGVMPVETASNAAHALLMGISQVIEACVLPTKS